MKKLILGLLASACVVAISPAYAQQAIGYRAVVDNKVVVIPVSEDNPLPTTGSGGGGAGDASAANQTTQITAANLTNTNLGPVGATACATDNGSCAINALIQRTNQRITSLITALGTPATAANQTTTIGHVDGIETLIGTTNTGLTTIDGRVDGLETLITSSNTKLDTLITAAQDTTAVAVADGGGSLTVDVGTALPAGTNNIGDIDVLTLPALVASSATIGTVRSIGSIAADSPATDPPVPAGCLANTSATSVTAGDVVNVACTLWGSPRIRIATSASGDLDTSAPATTFSFGVNTIPVRGVTAFLDTAGTNAIVPRVIGGALATGADTLAVSINPSSAAPQGVAPIVNTSNAALGSRVLCTAPCNIYHVSYTNGTSAGFLLIPNLTSDPADGTLAAAPLVCVPVAANARVEIDRQDVPIRASVGATAIFSTGASCVADTTATGAAMGWFEAAVRQ